MPENQNIHDHILVEASVSHSDKYAPVTGGWGAEFDIKHRNRRIHGNNLKDQLQSVSREVSNVKDERQSSGIQRDLGIEVTFKSVPGFNLYLKRLEDKRYGIELLSVSQKNIIDRDGNELLIEFATVYIPEGKLKVFFNKVEKYLYKDTKKGNPYNEALFNNINSIKIATLEALWTDTKEFNEIPEERTIWWETWLRGGKSNEERENIVRLYREYATNYGIELSREQIDFPERVVLLTKATKVELASTVVLLDCLAEVRQAKVTAEWFMQMQPTEQAEWVEDALSRIKRPDLNAPAICLLDSGVNNGHPLITIALADADLHTYDSNWGLNDNNNHGTPMAGIALYGDLLDLLSSSSQITLNHRLESSKIFHRSRENEPKLYGEITKQGIARAELQAPNRKRIFCMAVTTEDFRDQGQPSSWSSAIDKLSFGKADDQRLVILSGGNTAPSERHQYPNNCETEGVHDPGQSWNAITVGAFTNKENLPTQQYPNWEIIAPKGGLSPSSTTSLVWKPQWPYKPDIVMEGGNMALNPLSGEADYVDSLQLLSTYGDFHSGRLLTTFGDTSAASAESSRFASIIQSNYTDFWAETIRGLIVHSAGWTDTMLSDKDMWNEPKDVIVNILRKYGYGVPDLNDALWSANNSLTLIAQEEIQPFALSDAPKSNNVVLNEMQIHELPWPREVLYSLEDTEVEMKVTLSYFIEPNPGARDYKGPYSYASHGLRFDNNTALEDLNEFRTRVNKTFREDIDKKKITSSDSSEWLIGPQNRVRGSVHSDRWKGTAAALAEKNIIAIYPVSGWWKDRKKLGRFNNRTRYSLIITIKTEEQEVDLYTPITNLVTV
jgi:hypothetical protein